MEKTKFKFATVVWKDAFCWDDEHLIDFDFSPNFVVSSGNLIKENEDGIVLSRDLFPSSSPMVRGTIAIPKEMVVDVQYNEIEFEMELKKEE